MEYKYNKLTDILRTNSNGDLLTPPLTSDYVIFIEGEFEDCLLLQNLNFDAINNKFSFRKDEIGFYTASYSGSNDVKFTYFAKPLVGQNVTSVIHWYYKRQLTSIGTLRIRRENDVLPSVILFNLRTQQIVYKLKNCMFTYPIFSPNPASNDIVYYTTSVTFSDYDEYVNDNAQLLNNDIDVKNTYSSILKEAGNAVANDLNAVTSNISKLKTKIKQSPTKEKSKPKFP